MFFKISKLCLLAFVSLFLSSVVSFAGPSKTIRDWSVYCSDTLTCSLATQVDSRALYSFELQRDPEANAPLILRISIDGELKTGSGIFVAISTVLDEFSLSASSAEARDGYLFFNDPAITSVLAPALLKGDTAIVEFENAKGRQQVEISLSGSSAAALFMDEVQNRVGKVDALTAIGDAPATGKVTSARELKSTRDLPPALAQKWRDHSDECAGFDERDLIAQFGGIAIKLPNVGKGEIYIIPCGGPGAYNLSYAGFVFDNETNRARELSFPTMGNSGPTVMNTIINMSWDDDKRHLSAYYKGRGIGDCGVASIWQWEGGGTYGNFVLIEERAKNDCDGEDDEWPLVWPVQ